MPRILSGNAWHGVCTAAKSESVKSLEILRLDMRTGEASARSRIDLIALFARASELLRRSTLRIGIMSIGTLAHRDIEILLRGRAVLAVVADVTGGSTLGIPSRQEPPKRRGAGVADSANGAHGSRLRGRCREAEFCCVISLSKP